MVLRHTVGIVLPVLLIGAAAAQETAMERNSKVYNYFEQAGDNAERALKWDANSPAEHEAWRAEFDESLRELLGAWPEQVALDHEWDETFETSAFTRRKVYIRSEANYWVPAYYFVPKNITGKRPAIICLHGHSGIYPYIREGTEQEKKKGRDHNLDYAVHFAEQGYITLAVVQRGWNETRHDKPHSCHRCTMDAFLLGKTTAGLRVWDAMRALDFLAARDEVDAEHIGVAGLSGGGTTSLFFAALEPRVDFAMVAGYFCTFRDSIFTIHHCICNCVPGVMQVGEMSDVAGLIAPRPLLIISGDEDNIFPIEAVKKAYAELEQTYGVLGAADALESDFFEGVHEWSNRKTGAFLAQHAPLPEG